MAELAATKKEDYPSLADYLGAFNTDGEREFWLSRFRLWWDANPAFTPESPRGWLLKDNGRIKGFLGDIPSRMKVNGEPRTVHSVTTWMVDEELRDRSLELLMEQMSLAAGTLLFDTTPTDLVDEILRNLEFKPLPWGEDKESFVLLDPARCLKALLPDFFGASLAAKGAGPFLSLLERLRRKPESSGLRVARVPRAGAEFDTLWEKTEDTASTTNIRTAKTLNWHCAEDDIIEKRLYGCYDGDALTGYAVMRLRQRRGLRTLECADLWPTPDIAPDLISALTAEAQKEDIQLITFPHFSRPLGARYGEIGLFERTLPRKNLCLAPTALADALLKEDTSYFVGLQGDYGTAGP